VPNLPAACPASGTVSAFAVSASAVSPVAGSPFSTGPGSQPTGIIADPANGSIYVTDSLFNQLYTFSIQSSGVLSLTSTVATGTEPMGGTVVTPTTSGKFLYITNYKDGSISIYSLASGTPALIATSNAGSSGPLCVVADPDADRFLYTADYIGGTIGGAELNPSAGTLITNVTSGQPTCLAAITHPGGNKNGL
jgi:DNA-binding beta-propeller fold protein YncE